VKGANDQLVLADGQSAHNSPLYGSRPLSTRGTGGEIAEGRMGATPLLAA
jgi:hypothetical protein